MNEKTIALMAFVGSALIYGAVEAVKRTGRVDLRYLPFVGVGVGIVVGALLALVVSEDLIVGAMLGAMAGFAATGIHESKKNTQSIIEGAKENEE